MANKLNADQLAKVRALEEGVSDTPRSRSRSSKKSHKRTKHKNIKKSSSFSRSKKRNSKHKTHKNTHLRRLNKSKLKPRSNKKYSSAKKSQNLKYVHRFRSNKYKNKYKNYGYAYNFKTGIPGFTTNPLRKMMHAVEIKDYKDPVSNKVTNQLTYNRNNIHKSGRMKPDFTRSRYHIDNPLWEAVRSRLISKYHLYDKNGSNQAKYLTTTKLIQFAGASLLSPKEERAVIDATPDKGKVLHKIEYEKRESKQSTDVSQKLDDVFDRLADQSAMSTNRQKSSQRHYALIQKMLFAQISILVFILKQTLGGNFSDNLIRSEMYNGKHGSTNRLFIDALMTGENILKAYSTRKRSK